jgi:hypothetical protein
VLDGEEQLVEVVRLGMALLYFKTWDDRYGYAVPVSTGWEFRVASKREQQQIAVLYNSFRKNLREGFFYLPNPGTGDSLQ